MTYYEKPDRNKIYRNARARYPSWPARYALKFANDCLAYRLLFPKSHRPIARVEDHPAIEYCGFRSYDPTLRFKDTVDLQAPREQHNPWNPIWTDKHLPGKWRGFQEPQNTMSGVRIVARSKTGWYCDSFQDLTCHGVVVQLPAKKGRSVLLSGFLYDDDDDDYIQLRVDQFETAHGDDYEQKPGGVGFDEAMKDAERYAEQAAEWDREEADKYEAEQQIEEKKESICGLFKSRHDDGIEWAREQVNELVAEVRQLTDEPWTVGIYY